MTPVKVGEPDFRPLPGAAVFRWAAVRLSHPVVDALEGLNDTGRAHVLAGGIGTVSLVLDRSRRSVGSLHAELIDYAGTVKWLKLGHGYPTQADADQEAVPFAAKVADHTGRASLYFDAGLGIEADTRPGDDLELRATEAAHMRTAALLTYPGFDAAERHLAGLYVRAGMYHDDFPALVETTKGALDGWGPLERAALVTLGPATEASDSGGIHDFLRAVLAAAS